MSERDLASLVAGVHAARRRGDAAAALKLAQEVAGRRRDDPQALALLAETAHGALRYDVAIEAVTRLVKMQPKSALFRTRLGDLHGLRGQYPRALAQYERAARLDPALPDPVIGKTAILERQGKYAAARRAIEPLVRHDPVLPAAGDAYLRLLLRAGDLAGAIAVGRRVLDAGPPPGQLLRDVCLSMAKAHEQLGEHEQALEVAGHGHAMVPSAFDLDAYRRRIDRIIETFERDRIAPLPRGEESELPVFIVGMPRTGSTLVERIIAAHPRAYGAGELRLVRDIVDEIQRAVASPRVFPECVLDVTPPVVAEQSRRYLRAARRLAPSADRVVNKNLGNFLYLGVIQLLLPAARVIHVTRDAMDTCLSCYLERLVPSSVPFAGDLETLGGYYRLYERLMAHWREQLELPLLEVSYEDIVSDQEKVTRSLLDFCDLEWHEPCLRFHETKRDDLTLSYDQVRRPLYRSSVGRAAGYGKLLDPLRHALGR